jgi:radical SAM protein with 4Fe4S-binding SPASM domain
VNDGEMPPKLVDYLARLRPMLKSVCGRDWTLPSVASEHLGRPGAEFFLIFRDPLSAADLGDCLSYPEYATRLAALRRQYPQAAGVACEGFVRRDDGGGLPPARVRCPAGTAKVSVLPDGSVYPCYLLFGRPELKLGNLLYEPLDRILASPRLEFFRTFSGNSCPRRDCGHHAACRGGCPAVSLLVAGDLAAPDPRCAAQAGAQCDGEDIRSRSNRIPARS